MLVLLAQAADPLSGGAGYLGAGLLGLVLFWVARYHLPAKDQQIGDLLRAHAAQNSALVVHFDEVIEKKDRQIDAQRQEFTAVLATMMGAFRAEASAERVACEKHFETLAASMNRAFETLGNQLNAHSQRNQQWLELLRREIEIRRGITIPEPPGSAAGSAAGT